MCACRTGDTLRAQFLIQLQLFAEFCTNSKATFKKCNKKRTPPANICWFSSDARGTPQNLFKTKQERQKQENPNHQERSTNKSMTLPAFRGECSVWGFVGFSSSPSPENAPYTLVCYKHMITSTLLETHD